MTFSFSISFQIQCLRPPLRFLTVLYMTPSRFSSTKLFFIQNLKKSSERVYGAWHVEIIGSKSHVICGFYSFSRIFVPQRKILIQLDGCLICGLSRSLVD
ncbi:unnamed protein product [Amoebophrya sp. A25]|nr:unnamed protein product [Amoebophrya sp. A25]|eukprot:GSA25T00022995001.1